MIRERDRRRREAPVGAQGEGLAPTSAQEAGPRSRRRPASAIFTKTDVLLALARRGHGKSVLARELQGMYPRRVIFDSTGEYDGPLVVRSWSEFAAEIVPLRSSPKFELIYRFEPGASDDEEAAFDQALRVLYEFRDVQVVVEEVQNFATPHFLPYWLRQCLLTGRHRGLSLLFTTQRPGELHKTILSQCAHIFAGQLHDLNDLRYVGSFLGCAHERLTHLAPHFFLWFRPGHELALVHNSLKPHPYPSRKT